MPYPVVALFMFLLCLALVAGVVQRSRGVLASVAKTGVYPPTTFGEVWDVGLILGVSAGTVTYLNPAVNSFLAIWNPPVSFGDKVIYWAFVLLFCLAMFRVFFSIRPIVRKLLTVVLATMIGSLVSYAFTLWYGSRVVLQ